MIYTVNHLVQLRRCRFCGPCELEVAGPIETTPETLGEDIALACDDEAEQRGWKSNACPACAWEYRRLLRDEDRAERPVEGDEG